MLEFFSKSVKIHFMTNLPENFRLPDNLDYDDAIQGLDKDIKEEGGAYSFLGMIRDGRRDWFSFHTNMLKPAAYFSLELEEREADGKTYVDPRHTLANISLSGMIFGHIANEALYPDVNQTFHPYDDIVIRTSFLGESEKSFIEAGELDTARGKQIGYSAMAATILNQLDAESIVALRDWSMDILASPKYESTFMSGFGVSLYAAWDVYTDQMDEEGMEFTLPNVNDPSETQGDDS